MHVEVNMQVGVHLLNKGTLNMHVKCQHAFWLKCILTTKMHIFKVDVHNSIRTMNILPSHFELSSSKRQKCKFTFFNSGSSLHITREFETLGTTI